MAYAQNKDSEAARDLAAAQSGDENAFSALTEPYRRELQVHCPLPIERWSDGPDRC